MNELLEFIDRTWNLLAEILGSSSLQMFLLVGSGLLAVGLLVLALTRWGHSRPVWKCVVLSVAAHILLMGYAYGTRLMIVAPTQSIAENEEPHSEMQLNLIDEKVEEEERKREILDEESKPWNEFANEQPLPAIDSLPRPELDTKIQITRETPSFPKMAEPDRFKPIPRPEEASVAELAKSFKAALDKTTSSDDLKNKATEQAKLRAANRTEAELANLPTQAPTIAQEPPPLISAPIYERPKPPVTEAEREFATAIAEASEMLKPLPLAPSEEASEQQPKLLPEPASQLQELATNSDSPSMFKTSSRSPVRLGDGKPVPKLYALRRSANRLDILRSRGGSIETEQSVEAALLWLANHQEANGRWDAGNHGGGNETKVFGHDRGGAGANADTGITGLALLAFLAGGHSHMEGPYQENVRAGLKYLASQQDTAGSIAGEARLFARMYCHSMSLLALSEAFAMTGDQALKPAVEKGVAYSLQAQNRYDGGWRYQSGDEGDMSQFGWQALALHSAELGGVVVPEETKLRMNQFVDRCAVSEGGGVASYRPGHGPSTTMTAESLVSRYMLGQKVSDRVIREAKFRVSGELPDPANVNLYYWYYGTMAMYLAGGPEWEQWNERVKHALVSTQLPSGANRGSWNPDGVWASYGGRVYSTAISALILEVYYRYLPTTREPNVAEQLVPLRRR